MIEFVLNHKWYFFIVGEIIFWSSLIGFLLLRYAFNLKKLSKYAIILWLASDLWLLTLGVLDYMHSGTFDRFQMIIVIFLIYAFTAGKKDFKRLDRWIQRKVARWKGDGALEINDELDQHLYGKEHAKVQRKNFYVHFLIFVCVQLILMLFYEYNPSSVLELIDKLDALGGEAPSEQVINLMRGTSGISVIWTMILVADFIWSFSYTIWPKTEKKNGKFIRKESND